MHTPDSRISAHLDLFDTLLELVHVSATIRKGADEREQLLIHRSDLMAQAEQYGFRLSVYHQQHIGERLVGQEVA